MNIQSARKHVIKILAQYGLHILVIVFVSNVAIYTITNIFIRASSCMTIQQIQSDSRCLYIYAGSVYQKGTRASPHHGHPCGSDVTAVMPASHYMAAAQYLDPNLIGKVCTAQPIPTPTATPVPPTQMPTPTLTPIPTLMPTVIPTRIPTPTPIPTHMPVRMQTALLVPTSPSPTSTPTMTPTPIPSPTPFASPSAAVIASSSLIDTPTLVPDTPTPVPTLIPTSPPTPLPVPSDTPVSTIVQSPSPIPTQVVVVSSPVDTPVPTTTPSSLAYFQGAMEVVSEVTIGFAIISLLGIIGYTLIHFLMKKFSKPIEPPHPV